jgi:hypothetical protein
VAARHAREPAVAQDLDLRRLELPQLRERVLGAIFLPDTEGRVQDQDGGDRDRLDRDAGGAVPDPDAEVDAERREQDVDQRAPELADDAAP